MTARSIINGQKIHYAEKASTWFDDETGHRVEPQPPKPEMTGSEAVYGFVAWLTTRDAPITFGAAFDATLASELVDKFCKTNNLTDPREDWTDRLIHPTE